MRPNNITVNVETANLITTVRENRAKHEDLYLKACAAYREKVLEWLSAKIEATQQGETVALVARDLPLPSSHVEDYDRVIEMLGLHTEQTIEITQDAYQNYVQDEWDWTHQFYATAGNYVVT